MTAARPAIPPPHVIGPVSRTDFVRYQGASGDLNPLHHDEPLARSAGFPTVFAPGMWVAGLLGAFATDWLGPEHLRAFRARFHAQIWPGDVLTCTAEIAAEQPDGEAHVDVVLRCHRQGGQEAVTAWATFALPSG